jgi:hypothetical protein
VKNPPSNLVQWPDRTLQDSFNYPFQTVSKGRTKGVGG